MSCSSTPHNFDVQFFFNKDCFNCSDNGCGANIQQSKCVIYTGPNLSCSGIETNDSVELALQKIDAQICSAIGDYSTYQFNCLEDYWGSSITQESTFVDAITSYTCANKAEYDVFVGTTFPNYQDVTNARLEALEVPGITCASAGVTNTDTLQTVLNSYCTKFEDIDTELDISAVVWDACFTVPSTPSSISEGFDVVLDQICQVKASSATLPTFNNTGSCLPSPGSSDSLSDTIEKIKTRLCQTATYDGDNLTSSCLSIPSDQDLEGLLQLLIDKVDTFTANAPSYSGDFTVNPNGGPCDGVTISLATPINQDRFVASNDSDSSPGTLIDKLTAGTNITLDDTTTPGQVIINSSGTDNYTVLADAGDDTPGYLDDKLEGETADGITISIGYNGSTKKATITPSLDIATLTSTLFEYIAGNSDQLAALCSLIGPCIGATCASYTIENSTGGDVLASYQDCTTGAVINTTVSDGSTTTVCAKIGSVTASGCTITNVGACNSTPPPPTSKNMFIINETGSPISFDLDTGSQAYAPSMSGNVTITSGGFIKNTSGFTVVARFLTTMPSTITPGSGSPVNMLDDDVFTFPVDISNYNYLRVALV